MRTNVTDPTLTRLARGGLEWLLPPLCLGCRRTPPGGIDRLNLCHRCRARLRPVTGRRCPGCLVPVVDPTAPPGFPCGACRRRPPAYDRLLAGWLYEEPLPAVVAGLKYRRLEYLGAALGDALADRFASQLRACTAVVAVPLHWSRHLRRGYNQSERIARRLAQRLDRPLERPLTRRRTRAQTGLGRTERRANLASAFAWRGPRVGGRPHWLLVDDVLTTGATLDRAARTLGRGGVTEVTALVAALTPPPGRPE